MNSDDELARVKAIGGRSAFPEHPDSMLRNANGMTFRQYAAVAAMNGLLSNAHEGGRFAGNETRYAERHAIIAKAAVDYADALLAELAK